MSGLSCSMACGIIPDQGLNLCPLRWKVDSHPLDHQGSPRMAVLIRPKIKWKNHYPIENDYRVTIDELILNDLRTAS